MKPTIPLFSCLLLLTALLCSCDTCSQHRDSVDKHQQKIKVVIVTGGHDFERTPFFEMFNSFGDVRYAEAQQTDHSEIFEDISDWDYDVIVLYNMTQNISPKRRANFTKLLDKGVGLVALHHSIANFQDWPEYRRIIGAKYYLKPTAEGGVIHPPSQYEHDVDLDVHVSDLTHPVTQGLSDFAINDETYNLFTVDRDNRYLLTTDHPTSNPQLAWVKNYRKARVCYIQLGHGTGAYTSTSYRRLVAQAITWCAGSSLD
jgi:type 1 glutamine amidotransferase